MSRVWSSCNIRTFNLHISVVFLLALNHFVSVSGVVLNLASSDIAVWKESYTFQCSASPTSEIGNLVGFQKLGSICLLQPTCQLISNLPGYSCGCAGVIGTTTIYNLTISSVKFTDEYNWTCTHGTSDISDGFQVLVHSPVYNVSIEISGSMNDSVNITEGESVVFTCVIHGAKPAPTSSQVMWYIEVPPDNNKTLQGISGNPIPSDKTTSINLTYTAGTQDQGQKVFCAATNSLMVNRSVPAVVSSNKIQLNIQFIQCSCDWTIHFAYTQAILIVVVIIAGVASFLVFKEFKHKWLLCAVLGAILTVLGVTCAILLGVNDTCSSCKQGAYVAAAIFCALSLCVGVTTDIWVVLKFTGVCGKTVKWARVSCFGADVESKKLDGGKRKAPEGSSDPPPKTDSSPRRLPPSTGNVGSTDSPDRGDPSPRPQPPPTGNVPPAAPEDQGDSPVHTHPTPRRLPPLDGNISPTTTSASEVEPKVILEPESDVTRKKKKKKKKRSTMEESESKEMSEMKEEK